MTKFSSGVTLTELRSVAEVIVECSGIGPPCRDAKRSFGLLLMWFRRNWAVIVPWLEIIQLRDENDCVVNGTREILERGTVLGLF